MDLDTLRGTNRRFGKLITHPHDVRRYPPNNSSSEIRTKSLIILGSTVFNVFVMTVLKEITQMDEVIHKIDTTIAIEENLVSNMKPQGYKIGVE